MSILNEIFAHKKIEVEERLRKCPLTATRRAAEATSPALNFGNALHQSHWPALIAEIKRASPSKGLFLMDFDPLRLAKLYVSNGARAISILTDEKYFQGGLDDLILVRQRYPRVPLLCKDFIFHPYQVYEDRAAGADAILLIVAGIDLCQLIDLHQLASELGMAALVEVHDRLELEQALTLQPRLVGINNRDLHTFHTNINATLELSQFIPLATTVVSESGIKEVSDVDRLAQVGVHAILVGEALVTAPDPAVKVRELACDSRLNHHAACSPEITKQGTEQ